MWVAGGWREGVAGCVWWVRCLAGRRTGWVGGLCTGRRAAEGGRLRALCRVLFTVWSRACKPFRAHSAGGAPQQIAVPVHGACPLPSSPPCQHLTPPHPHPSRQAYAAARFAESVLLGLNGEKDVVECCYVESKLVPGLNYFASKVRKCTLFCGRVCGLRLPARWGALQCCFAGAACGRRRRWSQQSGAGWWWVVGGEVGGIAAHQQQGSSLLEPTPAVAKMLVLHQLRPPARQDRAAQPSTPEQTSTPHPPPPRQVRLGPHGVEEILPLGELSQAEQAGLEAAKPLLTKNIEAGIKFAKAA